MVKPVAWVVCLFVLALFCSCAQSGGPRTNRNAILISIDCMNQRQFVEYTRENPVMKNLVAFADDSMTFTRAYAHAPWTLPSHMSMLTGLYPYQHGRDVPVFMLKEEEEIILSRKLLAPTIASYAAQNGYRTAAFTGSGSISGIYGHDKGFEIYDESPRAAGENGNLDSPISVRRAIAWIHDHQKEPFFLFYHTYDLHHTPQISEDFVTLDKSLGRIFEALKRRGIYDRSLIIVTGDHGRNMIRKNNKCCAHGSGHYEENLNVPFVIKFPKSIMAGQESQILVRHIDLLPTFLDALKISYTDYKGPGVSIFKRLKASEKEDPSLAEIDSLSQADAYCARKEAVRWKHYNYIRQLDDEESRSFKSKSSFFDSRCEGCDHETMEELYDLATDPWETENLVGKPEYTDILREGRTRLERLKSMEVFFRVDSEYEGRKTPKEVKDSLRSLGYIE